MPMMQQRSKAVRIEVGTGSAGLQVRNRANAVILEMTAETHQEERRVIPQRAVECVKSGEIFALSTCSTDLASANPVFDSNAVVRQRPIQRMINREAYNLSFEKYNFFYVYHQPLNRNPKNKTAIC
jgi:hypothetical protein